MEYTFEVIALGVRGSVPVSGEQTARYGGNTSCYLVRTGEQSLLLDAGSGLTRLNRPLDGGPASGDRPMALLLTHAHGDHVMGLPLFWRMFDPEFRCQVCGPAWRGMGVRAQYGHYMSPPTWPVGPEAFRAALSWRDLRESGDRLELGGVLVEAQGVRHPGATVAYRLTKDGKRLVYAPDMELAGETDQRMTDFCRDCDLLLADGQYTRAEYPRKRGWGHSAMEDAAGLGLRAGVRRTILTHHAPDRTDDALDALAHQLRQWNPSAAFAREGDVWRI